ncbi:MAG: magnesium-dependent phosphatase-1 [Candidatus Korarchaeota archaeon]|nr:magnesium-dependent phosphatase-1 [Candidatus Korarchaeota archaeon]
MPNRVKLIVLDLDQVLWDHHDATSLALPLRRVDERTLVDASGDKVFLREGVRDFLERAKNKGIYLSTCSWNEPDKAIAALRIFQLDRYFDLLMVEPHPEKDRMMEKILNHFTPRGVREEETVFVDDKEEMLEKVRRRYPKIRTLRFHPDGDVYSFPDLERILLGG